MTKEKHLYRILFLTSIFLLLINDFFLKFEYHNYLTGKLSDFAGLFALPYFVSCFFPKKIKPIYLITGILFLYWKSELSQPIFDFAHSYDIGINRTVDYTDLVALLILPISYFYWNAGLRDEIQPIRIFKPIIIGICIFSFIATTVPEHHKELNLKSDYETTLNYNLETVKMKLKFNQDSIFIPAGSYDIQLKEKNADIWTKISLSKIDSSKTKISLDSIINFKVQGTGAVFFGNINEDYIKYMQKLTKNEIEKLFEMSIKKRVCGKITMGNTVYSK